MYLTINGTQTIGTIHNNAIMCERVNPKISKKFATSVHQYNIYLQRMKENNTIILDSENIDTLRDILNKIYQDIRKTFGNHKSAYFQMNLTLKGKA